MGLDIYHGDGDFTLKDFQKFKKCGHSFIFVKTSEGSSYEDPCAVSNFVLASKADMMVGGYHFFRGEDGETEKFFSVLSKVGYTPHKHLPPVIDYEVDGIVDAESKLTKLIIAIKNKYKITPILYASPSILEGLHLPYYHLWVAEYGVTKPSIQNWAFWQYTEHGKIDGYSNDFDLDRFYSNEEVLKEWLRTN